MNLKKSELISAKDFYKIYKSRNYALDVSYQKTNLGLVWTMFDVNKDEFMVGKDFFYTKCVPDNEDDKKYLQSTWDLHLARYEGRTKKDGFKQVISGFKKIFIAKIFK